MRKKYPVKIRLHPEKNSSLYALANIWPNKKAMLDATDKEKSSAKTCEIEIVNIYPNGKRRKLPVFSELHFYEAELKIYILSHECLHSTFYWANRTKVSPWKDKTEGSHNERFFNAHHVMLQQLYRRLADLKLGQWAW